ncbi:MAG TPA: DUF4391 domain-containing protein [Baekduia sp.]|nr:DUF4391 domain-containing protein [Baekduia sp.]
MTADDVIEALALPPSALVGRRVPKTLLIENASPTAADKRQVRDGVEELRWVTALKPSTIGVPDFSDREREYLEIAVMRMEIRPGFRRARLAQLVHRAIPYPVLLVVEDDAAIECSCAHKRWSQAEAGAVVLDGTPVTVAIDRRSEPPHWAAFRAALPLEKQESTSLKHLYQSWIDALLALEAASRTGTFSIPASDAHARRRQTAMEECARLENEIDLLCRRAEKETQTARKVELNGTLTRLRAELASACDQI